MKILLYIVLYLAIGLIFAVLVLRKNMKIYKYRPNSFFDLGSDAQGLVIFTLILWPVICVVGCVMIIVTIILNLIVTIASLGKAGGFESEEHDNEKKA